MPSRSHTPRWLFPPRSAARTHTSSSAIFAVAQLNAPIINRSHQRVHPLPRQLIPAYIPQIGRHHPVFCFSPVLLLLFYTLLVGQASRLPLLLLLPFSLFRLDDVSRAAHCLNGQQPIDAFTYPLSTIPRHSLTGCTLSPLPHIQMDRRVPIHVCLRPYRPRHPQVRRLRPLHRACFLALTTDF